MKFLRRTAHVVSILVLLMWALLPSLGANQRDQAEQHQSEAAKTALIHPIAFSILDPGTAIERTYAKYKTQWDQAFGPVTFSNWGLVLVALIGAEIAIRTLVKVEHQAEAARQAAVTASGTLKLTEAAQRAWVSLESLEVFKSGDHDRIIVASFKNSGRTPAHIVAANITIRGSKWVETAHGSSNESIADLPDLPVIYDDGDFVAPAILVADEISSIHHAVTIVNSENFNFLTLRPGDDRNVWIYGFIHYTDGLTPNVIRKYGWARRYDKAKSVREPKDIRFIHANKRGYNYAD